MKLMLDRSPAWAVESPNSVLIEPRRKVSEPRSIESKNQAVAMMRKILRWKAVIGSLSSRAAITALVPAATRLGTSVVTRSGSASPAGIAICPAISCLPVFLVCALRFCRIFLIDARYISGIPLAQEELRPMHWGGAASSELGGERGRRR